MAAKYPISAFGLRAKVEAPPYDRQRLADVLKHMHSEDSKDGGFITFSLVCQVEGDGRSVYPIPPAIRDKSPALLIECAEGMFGAFKREAVVVCSPTGGSLLPYWTDKSKPLLPDSESSKTTTTGRTTSQPHAPARQPRGHPDVRLPAATTQSPSVHQPTSQPYTRQPIQAGFVVPEEVVTIRGRADHHLVIISHKVVKLPDVKLESAFISSRTLFEGDLREMPASCTQFRSAIQAVFQKVTDPPTQKVYYAYTD